MKKVEGSYRNSLTPEQVARMRSLAESGASTARIAAALNRTMASVRTQAKKLGIKILTRREIQNAQSTSAKNKTAD